MSITRIEPLTRALAAVEPAACDAYARQAHLLVAYANQHMAARPDLADLLGPCPREVLYANHTQHARMFEAQLRLRSASALIDLLRWVYRTHLVRGIPLHCFQIDLAIWIEAINRHLEPEASTSINCVYQCLHDLHDQLVRETHTPQQEATITDELQSYFQRYLQALLKPDATAALRITGEYIKAPQQIGVWWEQILQPALYEIGHLWARGEITIGQEHMATAITQRVIAAYYPMILALPRLKGHIVVTASPGEYHEVGTRIVADLLEVNGWDVYCTGASTPTARIIALLERTQAAFLCISTTLPSSLPAVADLIANVRAAGLRPMPRILVGGQAYRADPTLWQHVGADYLGHTASEGLAYIEADRTRSESAA